MVPSNIDNSYPKVSIILPVYNSEGFIADSIKSVLNQSYRNFDLIIIDDHSTDNSPDIIREIKDSRIIYFRNKENKGVAFSRNIGLDNANGEYIAFIDSDDIWYKDKLERQIISMETLNLDLCVSYYNINYVEKDNISLFSKVPVRLDYKKLLKKNYIPMLTAVISASLLSSHRFKDVGHEDYLMWLSIFKEARTAEKKINFLCIQKPLAKYSKRKDSISANKLSAVDWIWNIYSKELNFPFFYAIFLMLRFLKEHVMQKIYQNFVVRKL